MTQRAKMSRRIIPGLILTLCFLVSGNEVFKFSADSAYAQSSVIRKIAVEGNRRVEPETVKSYLKFSVGDSYNASSVDASLKALFATGLFADVRIGRKSQTVVVSVIENPIVNQVAFEGNKEVEDNTLKTEVQLKAREIYTRARVQSDVQRILDVYQRQGLYAASVQPRIIRLKHNRVDLVYEIQEGPSTKVKNINFIGNSAFSDSQLRDVITTQRTGFFSFFQSTNVYDPDRLNLDREMVRRFYLKNGYADMRIISATAELDRGGEGFFLTFTIEEGEQYKFGDVSLETSLKSVDPEALRSQLLVKTGEIYNASLIDKSIEAATLEVSKSGFAFARIRPRIDRDPVSRTIGVSFFVEQGPRVYIERINIIGNVRTQDFVIRREFRVAEGDAYNRLMIDRARRRLMGLGFFKSVKITRERGSAPDRVVLNVNLLEQSTGEFSFGAGYSTNEGLIGDISVTERNLMGRGQLLRLKLSGSFERAQVELGFTEPRFLDRNLSAGIDLFHKEVDYSDESSYKNKKTGAGLRLGFPIAEDTRLTLNYRFTRDEINIDGDNPSQAIEDAAAENGGVANVSSLGYKLTYDKRNHRGSPTRGVYFTLSQDFAGAGGDVQYVRTTADARAYYPLTKKLTLVGRATAGHIFGWGDDEDNVRLLDHFTSVDIRGFEKGGIGPRDGDTDDALGGLTYYSATVELRFPFPYLTDAIGLKGAVFADVGSLFGNDSSSVVNLQSKDHEIRASAGASVLWDSPLGPLRADFAYAFLKDEDSDKEEIFRFGAATKF